MCPPFEAYGRRKQIYMRLYFFFAQGAIAFLLSVTQSTGADIPSELNGSALLPIESFGLVTKISAEPSNGAKPPFEAAVFKHYYRRDGMYRVEVTYLDHGGRAVREWIHANNNEVSMYYDGPQRLVAVNGRGAERNWMIDTATRYSLYPLQFLSPDIASPVDAKDGKLRNDYKAFLLSDLWNTDLWKVAAVKAKGSDTGVKARVFTLSGRNVTEQPYIFKWYYDGLHALFPAKAEKLGPSGEVNESFVVNEWEQILLKEQSGATSALSIPRLASLIVREDGNEYTFKVETIEVEANSARLNDKELYTLDVSMGDRILDEKTGKVIVVPK